MRIVAILIILIAAIACIGQPSVRAQSGAPEAAMRKITPEQMAEILRDAGYRAELVPGSKGPNSKYIQTAMSGYRAAVYFYDCADDGCASMQFSTGFDKSPTYTVDFANKWNAHHRYARASVDPSDGSFYFEYDFLVDGVTKNFIKENITLYDQQLGKFEKQAP